MPEISQSFVTFRWSCDF